MFTNRVAIDSVEIEWRPTACLAGNYSTNSLTLRVITRQTTFSIHSIRHQCQIYKVSGTQSVGPMYGVTPYPKEIYTVFPRCVEGVGW